MPCENYKGALTEAAATGSEPSSTLRTHLETCVSCRTALAEEQQLFTRIDAGLRTVTNAEPSPSFLPRVRARLNVEATARRGLLFPWAAGVVSAATVIVILAVWERRVDVPLPNPENNTIAQGVLPGESSSVRDGSEMKNAGPGRIRKQSQASKIEISRAEEADSVLIPGGQKEAVNRLLSSLHRGQVKPEELLTNQNESQLEVLVISPLQVSPMEMKPLEEATTEFQ